MANRYMASYRRVLDTLTMSCKCCRLMDIIVYRDYWLVICPTTYQDPFIDPCFYFRLPNDLKETQTILECRYKSFTIFFQESRNCAFLTAMEIFPLCIRLYSTQMIQLNDWKFTKQMKNSALFQIVLFQ